MYNITQVNNVTTLLPVRVPTAMDRRKQLIGLRQRSRRASCLQQTRFLLLVIWLVPCHNHVRNDHHVDHEHGEEPAPHQFVFVLLEQHVEREVERSQWGEYHDETVSDQLQGHYPVCGTEEPVADGVGEVGREVRGSRRKTSHQKVLTLLGYLASS